jgi:hypothetical protein
LRNATRALLDYGGLRARGINFSCDPFAEF